MYNRRVQKGDFINNITWKYFQRNQPSIEVKRRFENIGNCKQNLHYNVDSSMKVNVLSLVNNNIV